MSNQTPWIYPNPFAITWLIQKEHIDHYGHVNNVAYISQMEKLAWEHSKDLGLTFDDYQKLDRAMVVRSHHTQYLQPCTLGNELLCATWIAECNNKLTLKRKFQYICCKRNIKVFEADTEFVCTTLSNGRPVRMPQIFKDIYGNACVGVEA